MVNDAFKRLGLTDKMRQEAQNDPHLFIGRVASQSKHLYKVWTVEGPMIAEVSGKYQYAAEEMADYPAVGDFVLLDRLTDAAGNGQIHRVLSRKSIFAREMAGTKDGLQIVATNIDTLFICMSLNKDYNLRRLERYLSIAWDSGALPVIVLTKSDLCSDLEEKLQELSTVAMGVDVLVTTSRDETSYQALTTYLAEGQTVAFIGSSGVGKSSLINRLMGETVVETNGLRNDDKGRHTTTSRALFRLPSGGLIIDTPGMRELGIAHADLAKSFSDIDQLAEACKFRDCTHHFEPKCAVQEAVADGILSNERLESYWKLEKEAKYAGLNARMIEKEKVDEMFGGMSNMKQFRKAIKAKNRRGNR